ncbi:MAG: c-type cytochrome [Planctomycetes bacterium]|nr:c-type cytochrome [Planctomycetota bacterium]
MSHNPAAADSRSLPIARPSAAREGLALLLAAGVSAGGVAVWVLATIVLVQVVTWLTPRPLPAWHLRLAELPAGAAIAKDAALKGREVFNTSCASCHSASGLGKSGLGKDLVHSDFVADRPDASLAQFIVKGRAATDPLNTTKIPMPPKGGNDALTEDDIAAVVVYLRGLQDPRRLPALEPWTPPVIVVTEADKAKALQAAGGDAELAAYIASGNKLFHQTCVSCHGRDGAGIKGNGKALAHNDFIRSLDDDALLAFIKQGRGPSDPKNTTGIQMPPKGGNPALSDDDILDIISFLRTLQDAKSTSVTAK